MAMLEIRQRLLKIARDVNLGIISEEEAEERIAELWKEVRERRFAS